MNLVPADIRKVGASFDSTPFYLDITCAVRSTRAWRRGRLGRRALTLRGGTHRLQEVRSPQGVGVVASGSRPSKKSRPKICNGLTTSPWAGRPCSGRMAPLNVLQDPRGSRRGKWTGVAGNLIVGSGRTPAAASSFVSAMISWMSRIIFRNGTWGAPRVAIDDQLLVRSGQPIL